MKVELRNIGPINNAAIELDGLSLLVGPNGAGKTTLSTACYAVLLSHEFAEAAVRRRVRDFAYGVRRNDEGLPTSGELGRRFAAVFRDRLSKEFERCYSPDLSKLPRRGRTGQGSAPRVVVSHTPPGEAEWRLIFRIKDGVLNAEPKHPDFKLPKYKRVLSGLRDGPPGVLLKRLRRLEGSVSPVYFPAARSGYVQMQNVLYQLLVGALGRGYFDQVSLGKISGVAADFLEFVAGMDPSGESALPMDVVDRLEAELLNGHLRLLATSEAAKKIEFAPQGLDEYWPVDAAATSVVEVAPLLLYLRHRAKRRDLLFIDEPEAHLHPTNQLVFADVLLDVSMSIAGMVVGTHSEFFATGVSNGLLRRRARGDEELPTVHLYELNAAQTTGGYEAKALAIDDHSGFDISQFSDVADAAIDEAEELFEGAQRQEG